MPSKPTKASPGAHDPGTDADFEPLLEMIARQVHEEWVRRRLADGWRLGPARDDQRREHPSLVPYDELPEAEREYDRGTALTTIHALRNAGYGVVPPRSSGRTTAADEAARLLGIWAEHDEGDWANDPGRYVHIADRAIKAGKPLLAFEVTAEGLEAAPGQVRLQQLQALALARSGAPERASAILQALEQEGHADEETLGLLARTHKDAALRASSDAVRVARLREAFALYQRSYETTGGYYTGINAATLALLCGDEQRAHALAGEVHALALDAWEQAEAAGSDGYYPLATLAEAELVRGKEDEAQRWLELAAAAGAGRFGDLASTRRNLRLLLEARGEATELLESWLPLPRVALIRTDPLLWPAADVEHVEPRLRAFLDRWLTENRIGFGYCAGTAGTDVLFLERLQALNASSYLVLPWADRESGLSEFWAGRVERAAAQAVETLAVSEHRLSSAYVFEAYAGDLRIGLAQVHAMAMETELLILDVVAPGRGRAHRGDHEPAGARVEVMDIAELLGKDAVRIAVPPENPRADDPDSVHESMRVAGILFADVFRYSALEERQLPAFVEHFLGLVGQVTEASEHRPLAKNTWGDGLYFVFADVRAAGSFALQLSDAIAAADWAAFGLREDLSLRIGLHAGPVLGITDPVTGAPSYTGKHTIRAARIEPVTPPGTVYGSREFAALAAAAGIREFVCEPVGRVDLAKGAAHLPLFVVRRAAADA